MKTKKRPGAFTQVCNNLSTTDRIRDFWWGSMLGCLVSSHSLDPRVLFCIVLIIVAWIYFLVKDGRSNREYHIQLLLRYRDAVIRNDRWRNANLAEIEGTQTLLRRLDNTALTPPEEDVLEIMGREVYR